LLKRLLPLLLLACRQRLNHLSHQTGDSTRHDVCYSRISSTTSQHATYVWEKSLGERSVTNSGRE
jgi:hypothetical protein